MRQPTKTDVFKILTEGVNVYSPTRLAQPRERIAKIVSRDEAHDPDKMPKDHGFTETAVSWTYSDIRNYLHNLKASHGREVHGLRCVIAGLLIGWAAQVVLTWWLI